MKIKFKSIRTKTLIISIVISTLVIGMISFLYHKQVSNIVYENELHDNMITTISIVNNLEIKLEMVMDSVNSLAKDPRIASMDPEVQDAVLRDFLSFHPLFTNVFIFSPDLYITQITSLSTSLWKNELLGKQFNKPTDFIYPYATFAMRNKQSTFSGSHWDIEGWGLMFAAVAPIIDTSNDKEEIKGVVSAGIFVSKDFLGKLIHGYSCKMSSFIALVDDEENVIAKSGKIFPSEQLKYRISEEALPANVEIGDKFRKYNISNWRDNFLDTDFIITQAYFKTLNLQLYLAKDMGEIKGVVKEVNKSMSIIFVVTLLFVILIVIILVKSFLKPIIVLIESINKVAGGDLSSQILNEREDEIGEANNAFNRMVIELQKAKVIEDEWDDSSKAN
ncbi:MAG: HAMP domain-containing protein [Pseudomonadota bacterium]